MKCPFCGREMTAGYIQSGHVIFFTQKRHKVFFTPQEDEPVLTVKNWTAPTCAAHHCAACRKVIAEYDKEP